MDSIEPSLSPKWYEKIAPSSLVRNIADDPEAESLLLAMASKMDIESLLSFYQEHWRLMEQPSFLYALTEANGLGPVTTFREYLMEYERDTLTVRSYYQPGAGPLKVLHEAVLTKNFPVILEGLNLLETPLLLDPFSVRNEAQSGYFVLEFGEMYLLNESGEIILGWGTPSEALLEAFPQQVVQGPADITVVAMRRFVPAKDITPQLVKVELILSILRQLLLIGLPFNEALTLLKTIGPLPHSSERNAYHRGVTTQLTNLIPRVAQRELRANNSNNYFSLLSYTINNHSLLSTEVVRQGNVGSITNLVGYLMELGLESFRTQLDKAKFLIRLDKQSSRMLRFPDLVFTRVPELVAYYEELYPGSEEDFLAEVLGSENLYDALRAQKPHLRGFDVQAFLSLYGKEVNPSQMALLVARLIENRPEERRLIHRILSDYPVDEDLLYTQFEGDEWIESGFSLEDYLNQD